MNYTLYIDTTSNKEVMVSLNKDKKFTFKKRVGILKAQVVLPLIDKLLKKNRINLSQLTDIQVNTGPGSFTGIRVGLSVANALGFSLGIKVNGKEMETEGVYK